MEKHRDHKLNSGMCGDVILFSALESINRDQRLGFQGLVCGARLFPKQFWSDRKHREWDVVSSFL